MKGLLLSDFSLSHLFPYSFASIRVLWSHAYVFKFSH